MFSRIAGWKLIFPLKALARTGREKQNICDVTLYGFSAKYLLQAGPRKDMWFSYLWPVEEWQDTEARYSLSWADVGESERQCLWASKVLVLAQGMADS